jgi:hypothetical protein
MLVGPNEVRVTPEPLTERLQPSVTLNVPVNEESPLDTVREPLEMTSDLLHTIFSKDTALEITTLEPAPLVMKALLAELGTTLPAQLFWSDQDEPSPLPFQTMDCPKHVVPANKMAVKQGIIGDIFTTDFGLMAEVKLK